eukprot:NODE_14893_length_1079_cov_4.130252.p4 GENE.NODE_14893_length_1079_cov_4.130252~~NODE_14893_length_1079_cov_4.130252.p4  ORF type:complete len:91 (+),score=27.49 NODE_14893_length_1079_cov_4.130252:539-811(+)
MLSGMASRSTRHRKPAVCGETIGMLVDLNTGAMAFDLTGEHQGGCSITRTPKYLLAHLDTSKVHVELRKPAVGEAPQASFELIERLALLA